MITSGKLASWKKAEGEKIDVGDVIAEVELGPGCLRRLESRWHDEGFLAKILVKEGAADVPVGQNIAVIVDDEASIAGFKDYEPTAAAAAKKAAEKATATAEKALAERATAEVHPARGIDKILRNITHRPASETVETEKEAQLAEAQSNARVNEDAQQEAKRVRDRLAEEEAQVLLLREQLAEAQSNARVNEDALQQEAKQVRDRLAEEEAQVLLLREQLAEAQSNARVNEDALQQEAKRVRDRLAGEEEQMLLLRICWITSFAGFVMFASQGIYM